MVAVQRFDVVLLNLDPTIGSEMKKTRPAVIVSPDSMNRSRLKTVIIAPLTSTVREKHPTRVSTVFQEKKGQAALDQIRAVDRTRLIHKLGSLDDKTALRIRELLVTMFE